VTHPALALLIGPEFDEFLCAPIGADRNGTGLSVLSALARLNVDPWQEATSLAADLVALLPRGNSLNVRSSVRLFAPAGPRQTQILMVLSAFAIMTLIVFAISAADPGLPGIGENPLPPRASDATTVMPRR